MHLTALSRGPVIPRAGLLVDDFLGVLIPMTNPSHMLLLYSAHFSWRRPSTLHSNVQTTACLWVTEWCDWKFRYWSVCAAFLQTEGWWSHQSPGWGGCPKRQLMSLSFPTVNWMLGSTLFRCWRNKSTRSGGRQYMCHPLISARKGEVCGKWTCRPWQGFVRLPTTQCFNTSE